MKYYIKRYAPYKEFTERWWVYRQLWKGSYILPYKPFNTWQEAIAFVCADAKSSSPH